ncbi:MAG: 5'-methylthioadenosine/S-adenosylhomocysteine nucleosidase [Bacilli bacterium]
MIGIITGMKEERDAILTKFSTAKVDYSCGGFDFYLLKTQNAILAYSGIGKVFAAACASSMLSYYKDITTLISTGITGAIDQNLYPFNVLIGSSTVQADMDTTKFGDPKGLISGINVVNFKCATELKEKFTAVCKELKLKSQEGIQATCDKFVWKTAEVNEIRNEFSASSVDMETASIAQVAYIFKKDFGSCRVISDSIATLSDYETNKIKAFSILGDIFEELFKIKGERI